MFFILSLQNVECILHLQLKFGLTTSQVLNSSVWLMATVLAGVETLVLPNSDGGNGPPGGREQLQH